MLAGSLVSGLLAVYIATDVARYVATIAMPVFTAGAVVCARVLTRREAKAPRPSSERTIGDVVSGLRGKVTRRRPGADS
ncbi:hypothetical protein [Planobispora rosea]|uniref:hypothetical protein n=1 Tax=Planobispora rosea TaxID=35762 RepID=UPI00114CD1E9|nr:hypothetical protein [Planobispora rosea]